MGTTTNLAAAMKEPVVAIARIVTAFNPQAIGTKVKSTEESIRDFYQVLVAAIENHDPSTDRMVGQHFIKLPDTANDLVWCGVGKRTPNPEDYVIREHRGQVSLYLKRSPFIVDQVPVTSVHVVMYTKEAFLADPDGTAEEFERTEQETPGYTHVLVAVLAAAGDEPKLSPYRFVHNLAGGNNEALAWTADEIRAKAKEILAYENGWITVAD